MNEKIVTIRTDSAFLKLVGEARELTGIDDITALLRAGLRALIARETARRLIALGGSEPHMRRVRRRRARPSK